ncbi:carboxylesterase 1-like isoform X1 [Coffea eugenioides]|uniref:carboxylesterase 1-like isoform X1 n=1 Tax=Coffea eugenioides TaxID=49369 RepID=UPI000F60AABE|nr:carboxylesterase 1-like isoform X1 [Coffea eugenioides]
MADQIAQVEASHPPEDLYGAQGFIPLGFIRNPDGSITREVVDPINPVSSYDSSPILLVKDIPVNPSKNTWVRVFLPKEPIKSSPDKKLPLLIYIHGGGLIKCSAAHPFFDDIYSIFAADIPAVILTIEYRLAPEHRLPAAYEDCLEVLQWIKNSQDEWLTQHADLSNSFIFGNSAGGNIAYHVCLIASSCVDDLKPLNIKGVILHQPFLGGVKRTESELRGVNDKILPQATVDIGWELALPVGADRDHEFCNPMLSIKLGQFDAIKGLGWKILVAGYEGDPLSDRQVELAKILEENGVEVVAKFDKGGYHGIEFYELSKMKILCDVVKKFVESFANVTA